ncbi:N-acetylmuramoyl-L-alanine amidase [Streptomyces sp. NPDC020807]|uniref:peptidoglycan recognition protein family protein n=1 Tax=Streptomyces sp. NPDC020807 TaxID=3155119 RepID=UPI003409A783
MKYDPGHGGVSTSRPVARDMVVPMITATGPMNPRRRTFLTGALTGAFALGATAALPPAEARAAAPLAPPPPAPLAEPRAAASAEPPAASPPEPPAVADCGTWGAAPPAEPLTTVPAPPVKILVHHTATPNVTDYSREAAFRLARSMQHWAIADRGWSDTGQHFTLSRGGHVVEGRHGSLAELRRGTRTVESAHCTGQNTVAIGIETEGTYGSVDPRETQYEALVDLCAHICHQYGLRAYQIYGHRDFNATECPGDRLYALLPKLRADVADRIGGDPAAPEWPVLHPGDSGPAVRALQHLLAGRGAPLAADGFYGPATDRAVRDFRALVRATPDALAGPQLWHQLSAPVRRDASGESVRAVQLLLAARGLPTPLDGVFGPVTEKSVTAFQEGAALPPDGRVDARTFARLLA